MTEIDKDKAEHHEQWKAKIYEEYLGDNGKKLRRIALSQCGRFLQNGNINEADYMSVANETLWKAVEAYDGTKNDNFQAFLSMCLHNRLINEFNRIQSISQITVSTKTTPIETSDDGEIGLAEILTDNKRTEDCINPYGLSDQMFDYVSSFYGMYREIIDMFIEGCTEDEIIEILHLTRRQFADCMNKLRSHKHIALIGN